MALGWLVLFSRVKIAKPATGILTFLSSSSFAVYLIHDNETVRRLLIKERFAFLSDMNLVLFVLCVFAIAILIFTICVLFDKARMLLFRGLKVDQLTAKMNQGLLCISNFVIPK